MANTLPRLLSKCNQKINENSGNEVYIFHVDLTKESRHSHRVWGGEIRQDMQKVVSNETFETAFVCCERI